MLEKLFKQPPTKIFLQDGYKSYTYDWLKKKISRVSGLFKQLNLQHNDRLLLAISDEAEMSALFISALLNGITVVIADPESKSPRGKSIISKTSPAVIIADKETLDNWKPGTDSGTQIISYQKEKGTSAGILGKFLQKTRSEVPTNDYFRLLENVIPQNINSVPQPDDHIAYIIFTSGTTSDSKGVAITRLNLEAHLVTLEKVYSLNEESSLLNLLFLCHADGCIQGPILAAQTGCSWHKPFRFSMKKIPEFLDYGYANSISHIFVVPAMLHMILPFAGNYEDSFDYPEFRAILSVSAHLDAGLWDAFESTFKIRLSNIYGLTETVAGSLFCGPLNETYQKYSIGKPIDCEIRIVDDSFNSLPHGETGELCLKGDHIMKQYWGSPAMTDEAFRKGWFLTGDLASMDEGGFVTIRGRKKNLIISGGINIQPEEITECLLKLEPVHEACAIGMPDEVFGEKLFAVVVLKPGFHTTGTDLIEKCRISLEEKKVPHRIIILEEFPKGVSGKVQLSHLRELLVKQQSTHMLIHGNLYENDVLAIAADSFQVPVSALSIRDTSQTIAGWDSLAHLGFITSLEEHFKVRFNTSEIITMNSIRRATDLIKEKNG
jgi:long-chain acyl-CoA synthetase